MTGTWAITGAIWLVQQDWELHVLKLYECHDATRLWSGSVGSFASQPVRSLAYSSPPSMITLFAPPPRTALIICCIPATGYEIPVQGLPVSQHCHPSAELLLLARHAYGSLNRSKITASLPLKVFATDVQN